MTNAHPVLSIFQVAAQRVPAYRRILAEAGVRPEQILSLDDFLALVPILDKNGTFYRFPLAELCLDGELGRPSAVLTSSGHSGRFSFGLYERERADAESRHIDDVLDAFFSVRSRPTLLINCLPMGVKVTTRACTLAETSVRADMVTAIVRGFGEHYEQIIIVGDTAFVKHVVELGQQEGVDWPGMQVHVIVGEEPIAENARKYLELMLGIGEIGFDQGFVGSSMGVAELGLNLFVELPGTVSLRRVLHEDARARQALLGPDATHVPMLFTYDPSRVFVETLPDGRLVLTPLDAGRRVPLVRYATGDIASLVGPEDFEGLDAVEDAWLQDLKGLGLAMVHGRGRGATAGGVTVHPEQVKEGLYLEPELARLTTANFRLTSGSSQVTARVQLSPGMTANPQLERAYEQAIARYAPAPVAVVCETYAAFSGGMALDYERKFDYLADDEPAG